MTIKATSSWEWESDIENHRVVFLNNLLTIATASGLIGLLLLFLSLPQGTRVSERLLEVAPFIAGWLFLSVIWAWRDLGYHPRALSAILLTYALGVFTFRRGGLPGSGRAWLLVLPAVVFLLEGLRAGIIAGSITILTYVAFGLAFSQQWITPLVVEDPAELRSWISEGASFLIIVVSLAVTLWASNRGWIDALARTSKANEQLQERSRDLQKTNERLRRQTSQLKTTAEIARAGASILELKKLQSEVVNQIREGFSDLGVYYVGLFLLDESQRFAVLITATGEAGKLLLNAGYKVELSEKTTVGRCIIHQQPCIALNARKQAAKPGPLSMSRTRSEIALPLRSRGHVLGALTVQSTQEAAFKEADIAVLQTMADQVAVAIDNARLFSQTEAALNEVRTVQQRYMSQVWGEFLASRTHNRIDYTQPGTEPEAGESLDQARRAAMTDAQTVAIDSPSPSTDRKSATSQATLVVPLKLREQVIGTIALQETRRPRSWTTEDIALAETIAEQASLTIETLRLMDETQRHAAHERLVSEITGRVWASLNPDTVLKTTSRELGRALGAERVSVEITGPVGDDQAPPYERPLRGEEG